MKILKKITYMFLLLLVTITLFGCNDDRYITFDFSYGDLEPYVLKTKYGALIDSPDYKVIKDKREHYQIVGWARQPGATKRDSVFKPGKKYNILDNETFYAIWEHSSDTENAPKIIITYVANNPEFEEFVEKELEALKGQIPDFTYCLRLQDTVGYKFKGWYFNLDYKEAVDFTKEFSEDVTIYAKWEKK